MTRLPNPGSDDNTWGTILNQFLEVSLNNDGTIQTSALTQAGGEVTSNKGLANGYASLNGTSLVPTTQLGTGAPGGSNFLRGDATWAVPPSIGNATSSTPGLIQLSGDIGGSATSPTVVSTHLASALPINQGGTGSTSQNFVDLSSNQTIAGTKTFSSTITGSITGNAATVTTNANLTGDVTSIGNATTLTNSANVQSVVNNLIATNTNVTNKAPLANPTFTGKVTTPALQVTTGSGTANQVLTSDSSGNATWATAPGVSLLQKFCYLPDGWNDCWVAAKANSGTTSANFLQIGDSIGQGMYTSNLATNPYFWLVRSNLLNGFTLGGDHYPIAWCANFNGAVTNGPWVTSNMTFWSPGAYQRGAYTTGTNSGTVATFTAPYACTDLDIVYCDYATGTWQYAIDGGTPVTVTVTGNGTSNATNKIVALTGLSNTTHTVTIQNTSSATAACLILGISTYKNRGIGLNFVNFSYTGDNLNEYTVDDYGNSNTVRPSLFQGYTPQSPTTSNNTGFGFPTQPHLAIFQLGINDLQAGYTIAAFQSTYTKLIQAVRRGQSNASIIFISPSCPDGVNSDVRSNIFTNAASWNTYLFATKQLAEAFNCAWVNIHAKWGETGVAQGFQTASQPHPTNAGHQDIANVLNTIL